MDYPPAAPTMPLPPPCSAIDPAAAAPAFAAHAALRQALADLDQAEAVGRPSAMAEAYQRLAQCYRALDALPTALSMHEQALRWARSSGAPDQGLDLQCELIELLAELADAEDRRERGRGRPLRERARDQVFDATRRATGCADSRWEVTLLLRLSDVLDRFGDRDDATVLQVRALQLTVGVAYAPPAPRAEDAAGLRRH